MKKRLLALFVCWLSLQVLPSGHAQQPGGFDSTFTPGKFDQQILQIVARPGGAALVAGYFSQYNGTPVGPIVQLQKNGTLDNLNFANTNTDYLPTGESIANVTLATDSSGRIMVSMLTTPSYTASLVRLNPNGTLDTTFHATVDGPPSQIVTLPNGQIMIAGAFSTVNGVYLGAGIARLNEDGSRDTSFDPGPRAGVASYDYAFIDHLVYQDGKFIIGGGINPNYDAGISRLNFDGSRDTTFALAHIAGVTLQAMELQPAGGLIVTYNADNFNGQPYPYIARLKATSTDGTDGQFDASFQPATLGTFPRATVVQADGKIVLSLDATIVRLNADGGADRAFSFGATQDYGLRAVLAQTNSNDLLLAFTPPGESYEDGIAGLYSSVGGNDTTVNVVVPATANIWLARDGSTDQADATPVQQPVRVADLALHDGDKLSFTATGAISFSGGTPTDGPEGESGFIENHAAENGISGVKAPLDALVGVFIDDATASNGVVPATLDFGDSSTRDFNTFSPALGQVFFIGDGKTLSGSQPQVIVPAGAAHLVLGTVDGLGWYNNTGAFAVTITPGAGGGGPGGGIVVPGTADIWLAGQRDGTLTTVGEDLAPTASPVLVPNLKLDPNLSLNFTATGGTGNGLFTSTSPDGALDTNADHPPELGSSGIVAPTNSLVGIFLSDTLPPPGNKEGDKPIFTRNGGTASGGINYSGFRPQLNEAFFIGDGKDADGNPQQVYPPTGATRLYLGSLDARGNTDNTGQFSVTVAAGGYDASDLTLDQHATAGGVDGGGNDAAVAFLGNTITYTYIVGNFSHSHTLSNAVLTAQLPSHTTFVSATGGGVSDGNHSVGWLLPAIPYNIGHPYTVQLTVRVNLDSPLEQTINDSQVRLYATNYPEILVRNTQPILLRGPIGFAVSSDPAAAVPNNPVTFTVAVTNTSYGATKGAKVTVPIPDALINNFKEAYFYDKRGVRVDATRQGNNLVFKVGQIASGATLKLFITLNVPSDIDPKTPITLSGASIDIPTAGTTDAVFSVSDFSTPIVDAGNTPQISFAKAVIDPLAFLQLTASQPKLAKQLAKLLPAILADPTQLATFDKVYPGLAQLNPLTATLDEFFAAIDPNVSYITDSDVPGKATILTVDVPDSKQEETYAAFVLGFSNSGGTDVKGVVVTDRVPEGMSILDENGNFNGSVIIKGKLASPALGNVQITDGGQGLTFNVGNLKAGDSGYVIYKLRLLTANETGSLKGGDVVSTSGSNLYAANLSRQYIGQPDGQDLEAIGKYAYFFESDQLSNSPKPGEPVIYALRYRNTGNKASKILEIDDAVPAGLSLTSIQAFDLDNQPLSVASSGAVTLNGSPLSINPTTGAVSPAGSVTSGTLVFHPPLMNGKGKVVVGEGGTILVRYAQLGTGNYAHSATIPASSLGTKAVFGRGSVPRAVGQRGPVRRVTNLTNGITSSNGTRVDDPALARVFLASATPMTLVEGQYSDIFFVVGSTNDAKITTPNVNLTVPNGLDVVGTITDDGYAITKSKDSLGNTQISLLPYSDIPGHGALLASVTVIPRAGFASQTPLVFPNFSLGKDRNNPVLQTGPVSVRVMTESEFNSFSALQGQVASAALTNVATSSPKLQEFISHVGNDSRTVVVAGGGALAGNNGAILVPLLGNPENTLAIGPSSAVGTDVLQNGPRYTQNHSQTFTVMWGRGDQIQIGAAAANSGTTNPQKAAELMAAIRRGDPQNVVKLGAYAIHNNGGNNLLGSDGYHLIGQDGNGLTTTLDQVTVPTAIRAAAGRANADRLIGQDGNGLIGQDGNGLIGQDGNGLIGQDGNGILSVKGGGALSSNGAPIIGENGSGIIGENGSGIIGENSSGIKPSAETGISASALPNGTYFQSGSATGIVAQGGGNHQ